MSDITSAIATADMVEAFKALPVREQLRTFAEMANELNGYNSGYDLIADGIEAIASDMASEEKWKGDDLAARYLEPDFPMSFQRVPPVRELNPAIWPGL